MNNIPGWFLPITNSTRIANQSNQDVNSTTTIPSIPQSSPDFLPSTPISSDTVTCYCSFPGAMSYTKTPFVGSTSIPLPINTSTCGNYTSIN